jgi:hypothetical protein
VNLDQSVKFRKLLAISALLLAGMFSGQALALSRSECHRYYHHHPVDLAKCIHRVHVQELHHGRAKMRRDANRDREPVRRHDPDLP